MTISSIVTNLVRCSYGRSGNRTRSSMDISLARACALVGWNALEHGQKNGAGVARARMLLWCLQGSCSTQDTVKPGHNLIWARVLCMGCTQVGRALVSAWMPCTSDASK